VPTIQILSDQLASQIAAGEVVERPASVVKELVENALDAGAREVQVDLEAGGRRRIRVADDGSGMERADALLAFDRHATSKIHDFADLERVATLGFRGEALASIASVARVELTTAITPEDGWRVRIEGGRVSSVEPAARPRGSTVEVASLFFNVPARRKFLKTPETELRRALEFVQGYGLSRPGVRFLARHEGRVLLDLPVAAGGDGGESGMRDRIRQVFGRALADELVPITAPTGQVEGHLGKPSTAKGRRQFVFVNHRLVRDRAVLALYYRAVREEWRSEDFPALFLHLNLPPEEVDVNVHPQKAEVRFRDPRFLVAVEEALRRALGQARGFGSAPGRALVSAGAPLAAWEGLGARRPVSRAADGWIAEPGGSAAGESGEYRIAAEPGAAGPAKLAEAVYAPLDRQPVPLSGRSGAARTARFLGHYKGTLLLVESQEGLMLVDQHVAHERVLYERLRRDLLAAKPEVQSLLEPIWIEASPAERLRLSAASAALEVFGFDLREHSGGTLALTALPAGMSAEEAERLVLSLASAGDVPVDTNTLRLRLVDSLAASLACRAAVKMHHPLSAEKAEALLAELFEAEQPFACPHGRPVALLLSDRDLETRFGRR
jgi:DNA mismatch repair protein MutL